MLSIIVAKAKNNIIGNQNKIIWNIPEDMKYFKEKTTNHVIIMGRKTFDSLGRVLPNRKHIVLTQNEMYKIDNENVKVVHSISEIQKYIEDENENFVIGGAMIYKLLMPYCTKMYITEIDNEYDGDTYFPEIDKDEWVEIKRTKGNTDENIKFDFVVYERKGKI